jgi:hypothetical protein
VAHASSPAARGNRCAVGKSLLPGLRSAQDRGHSHCGDCLLGLAHLLSRCLHQLARDPPERKAHIPRRIAASADRDHQIGAFGFQFRELLRGHRFGRLLQHHAEDLHARLVFTRKTRSSPRRLYAISKSVPPRMRRPGVCSPLPSRMVSGITFLRGTRLMTTMPNYTSSEALAGSRRRGRATISR